MISLSRKLQRLLFHVAPSSTSDASRSLKGLPGRGDNGYGRMLRDWLARAQTWLGEPVEVEYIDNPQDHGVDILMTGLVSASRIGIQIKSDNDLKSSTFQRELKAQITESQAFGVETLVVIFGCDPYPPNEARIQHFVMESRRYQTPRLVVIPPERAAGILAVFSKPLAEPQEESRPWTTFFDDVGHSALIGLYLDRWHPLSPDDRFVAPACLQDVEHSVATHPVTCVVGPPATGKTFLAALLAHRHWVAGKPVSWIASPTYQLTEGPLSVSTGLPDARQRVDFLSRQLGLRERHPPLDPTEFVAKHFLPESFVYIEDPFGKTPAEFTTSLHTYPFFDLDAFLTLLAGAARASARVLITSREGLFERWLRERGKDIDARVNVVRLQSGSYSFRDRVDLANKLAGVQKNALSSEIVEHIARQLETPFEVEQCVHALPQGATDDQAKAAAEAARQLSLASATSLVRPETDGDRLFLLCLCALTRSTAGRNYFSQTYEELFTLLSLSGTASSALESAMEKYDSVVTRTPIGDARNPAGIHLDPVHSTVLEAARAALVATCVPFMRMVARALPTWGKEDMLKYTAFTISELLLKLGIGLIASPEQDAYFALMAHGRNPFQSGRSIVAALPAADARFRELLGLAFAGGSMEAGMLLGDVSAALRSDTDPADGWFVASALLGHPTLGAGRFEFSGPPWDWVWGHAAAMPPTFEDQLRQRLKAQPALVVYAMATSIVEYWATLPTWMKAAIDDHKVVTSGPAQGRLLIEIARHWDAASELHAYFQERVTSSISRVRAAASIAALVHYENAPSVFESVSLAMTADPDITVPLEVFEEGLGQEDFCQSFAARLCERADDLACADMFSTLLSKNDRCSWQDDLLRACEDRGGVFAQAVRIVRNFGPLDPLEMEGIGSQDPILTLARLWRFASVSGLHGPHGSVDVDAIASAMVTLPRLQMLLALRIFTSEWRYLPAQLRRRLSAEPKLGTALPPQEDPEPAEAQEQTSRTLRSFPIRLLVALRQRQEAQTSAADGIETRSPWES